MTDPLALAFLAAVVLGPLFGAVTERGLARWRARRRLRPVPPWSPDVWRQVTYWSLMKRFAQRDAEAARQRGQ